MVFKGIERRKSERNEKKKKSRQACPLVNNVGWGTIWFPFVCFSERRQCIINPTKGKCIPFSMEIHNSSSSQKSCLSLTDKSC